MCEGNYSAHIATRNTQIMTRTANDILQELLSVEAKLNAGEQGRTALKAYQRKLYREYTKAIAA